MDHDLARKRKEFRMGTPVWRVLSAVDMLKYWRRVSTYRLNCHVVEKSNWGALYGRKLEQGSKAFLSTLTNYE